MNLILSDQTVTVNSKTIPKLYGGFGAGQPAILAKQVAEIHGYTVKQINQLVYKNLDWFDECIDYLDLKSIRTDGYPGVISNYPSEETPICGDNPKPSGIISKDPLKFLVKSGLYPNSQAVGGAKYIYLFSQQGYAMLCKLLKSDLAKQIYKQMVREYFRMASFPVVLAEQKVALEIAQTFGLQGNQAILFANRLIKDRYGLDILEIGGQPALISEIQEIHLTPTAIGKMFGVSPQKVNKLIEKSGLQESFRDAKNKKCWKPTKKGKEFSVLKDTSKKHKDGRPIQQLMWLESVISVLRGSEKQSEFSF